MYVATSNKFLLLSLQVLQIFIPVQTVAVVIFEFFMTQERAFITICPTWALPSVTRGLAITWYIFFN